MQLTTTTLPVTSKTLTTLIKEMVARNSYKNLVNNELEHIQIELTSRVVCTHVNFIPMRNVLHVYVQQVPATDVGDMYAFKLPLSEEDHDLVYDKLLPDLEIGINFIRDSLNTKPSLCGMYLNSIYPTLEGKIPFINLPVHRN